MASSHVNITNYHTQIPGGLRDENTWEFPVVSARHSSGREMYWQVICRAFSDKNLDTVKGLGDGRDVANDLFLALTPRMFDNPAGTQDDIFGWIKVESGLIGGKMRSVTPTIVTGGKKLDSTAETTPFCQALRDALGLYTKKVRAKGLSLPAVVMSECQQDERLSPIPVSVKMYPPMLAKKYEDRAGKFELTAEAPGFLQRKYNGLRVISVYDPVNQRVTMYSRSGVEFVGFGNIRQELEVVFARARALYPDDPIYFDGEAYLHGVPLQVISGDARRAKSEQAIPLDYMVYDCWIPSKASTPYGVRLAATRSVLRGVEAPHVKLVETFTVASLDDAMTLYRGFLQEGYEGAILRLDEPYVVSINSRRSDGLLKIKPELDEEFEIVGYSSGKKGKAANSLMITCALPAEIGGGAAARKEFNVTPALPIPVREELYKKMGTTEPNGKTHFENQWAGRMVTVTFAEKSTRGIPTQARTKLEGRYD